MNDISWCVVVVYVMIDIVCLQYGGCGYGLYDSSWYTIFTIVTVLMMIVFILHKTATAIWASWCCWCITAVARSTPWTWIRRTKILSRFFMLWSVHIGCNHILIFFFIKQITQKRSNITILFLTLVCDALGSHGKLNRLYILVLFKLYLCYILYV